MSAVVAALAPLDWRRVYIFPTRHGFGLGVLLLLILLGAINYDNALAYLLCFLLAGLGLVAMLHTYRNLAGLAFAGAQAAPVFAGSSAEFELALTGHAPATRYAVHLARLAPVRRRWFRPAALDAEVALPRLTAGSPVILRVPAPRRGRLALGRLRLESSFPLGLLRAWAYLDTDATTLVYPAPQGGLPLPRRASGDTGEGEGRQGGIDDFLGLRPYRAGDSPRALHWPAIAREGAPQVRQFGGGGREEIALDWHALPSVLDTEARLSQLARWVLEAERLGQPYALTLPGVTLPPALGAAHRAAALRALALHGIPGNPQDRAPPVPSPRTSGGA